MLRQLALTAKRTMTRAGDVNDGLDRGAAIRERPLARKEILVLMLPGRVQTCVRPISAARMAAGPDAIRGSSPYQLRGFEAPP